MCATSLSALCLHHPRSHSADKKEALSHYSIHICGSFASTHNIIASCARSIMAARAGRTQLHSHARTSPGFLSCRPRELLKWRALAPNKCINYFNWTHTQAHHICRSLESPLCLCIPTRPSHNVHRTYIYQTLVFAPRTIWQKNTRKWDWGISGDRADKGGSRLWQRKWKLFFWDSVISFKV